MNEEYKVLNEICESLINMEYGNKLWSKIEGNRNWAIKTQTENNKMVAYVGRYKVMYNKGYLTYKVKDIVPKKINVYTYTYKKDCQAILKILEKLGFMIEWVY